MTSIVDIAREAKCSISTVSYALTGKRPVEASTRERILAVCQRMGYVPNAAARNLRTQRTEVVGLLLYPTCASQFRNVFTGEVIEGVEEGLIGAGYHMLVGGYTPQIKGGTVPMFMGQGRVDGVILLGNYSEAVISGLHALQLPLLWLDANAEHLPIDGLTTDGFTAGRRVVDYLLEKGHRRLLMLGYSLDGYNARMRRQGFLDGIRHHRLGTPDEAVIAAFVSHEDIYSNLRQRLAAAHPPTAVFCENDALARTMIERLRRDGIDVPGTVSVVGFNNDEDSTNVLPQLTTFNIDKRALGQTGAKMILERIAAPQSPIVQRRLAVSLIERDSVANRR